VSDPRTVEVVNIVTELDGEDSIFSEIDTWRASVSVKEPIYSRCDCIKKERRF
jgi:hypothetical protein